MKVKQSNFKVISALIFGLIGLIFLLIALVFNIDGTCKKNHWIESEATITSIDHHNDFKEISYVYKGVTYTITSSSYSSLSDVGDIVKISINPNNPKDIYEHEMSTLYIVFYCVAFPFLIISAWFFISHIKLKKMKKLCLESAVKKVVDIVEIVQTNFHYNDQPYYQFKVKYSGNIYKSQLFLFPLSFNVLDKYVVNMYYIDDKKYYIDLDSVRKKEEFEF